MESITHISHRLKYTCAFDEGTRARPTPHFCKHYDEVAAIIWNETARFTQRNGGETEKSEEKCQRNWKQF